MMKGFNLLVFVVISFACQSTLVSDNAIDNFLKSFHHKPPKVLMIVPIDGCSGCVSRSIDFIKSNINNDNITYIITSHGSKKAKIRFVGQELKNPHLIIDSQAKALKQGFVSSYPVIYYLGDNKEYEKVELTAANSEETLMTLKKRIGN